MPTAIVVLTGSEGVSGSLTFTADGASTHLTGEITGLAPGLHGLHVHQVRFCRAGVLEGGTFWWGAGRRTHCPRGDAHRPQPLSLSARAHAGERRGQPRQTSVGLEHQEDF